MRRISLQEKYKKQQNARIIKPQETYVSGDLVKFMNQAPSNKLSPSWKGPTTILEEIGNKFDVLSFFPAICRSLRNLQFFFSIGDISG